MSTSLLGVTITTKTPQQALAECEAFLASTRNHTIFTPNPEILVKAHRDVYFAQVLNSASLSVCDGKGIEFFAREKVWRFPGVDLMKQLCGLAEKEGKSIFLLGSASAETAQKTAVVLQNQFPHLKIAGFDQGPHLHEKITLVVDSLNNETLVQKINDAKPDILFVAFGMGKQEKWIYENVSKLPSVKIAMGVGGSFDYIAGVVPRAPRFMRQLGLEWLYRLVAEPWRFKRIWTAVVVFPILAIKQRLCTKK